MDVNVGGEHFMGKGSNVTHLTASGVVCAHPCKLRKIVANFVKWAQVIVYDNATAGSGTVLAKPNLPYAGSGTYGSSCVFDYPSVYAENGLYCTFSGATDITGVSVYFDE